MPDSKDLRRWIQYAKEDYEAAMLILLSHPRNASFDFQQSAEKIGSRGDVASIN